MGNHRTQKVEVRRTLSTRLVLSGGKIWVFNTHCKVAYKLFKAQSIYSLSLKKHSTILIELKIVTNITHILFQMFILIYKIKIVKLLCFKTLELKTSIYRMQNLRKVVCQSEHPQHATEGSSQCPALEEASAGGNKGPRLFSFKHKIKLPDHHKVPYLLPPPAGITKQFQNTIFNSR